MMRNRTRNLISSGAPMPNQHSRYLLHATYSYGMDADDFLPQENPLTWAGDEPANLGHKASAKLTRPPKWSLYTAGQLLRTDNTIIHSNHKMKGSKMSKIRISVGY
ncbi:hypothetical protein TNCV_2845481 [Trichonephila clavipes]|nr:hypothetical protein TNCV_2845481 [Trichonephila clavipes]